MPEDQSAKFECGNCQREIADSAEYCPNCGGIYTDDMICFQHGMTRADGVCVFCSNPFCESCGIWKNNVFCCNSHSNYSITSELLQFCAKYKS